MALDIMIVYLHLPPDVLLQNVGLLEMIATLLPNLARRIIQILSDMIDDITSHRLCSSESLTNSILLTPVELAAVLEAIAIFPLEGEKLTSSRLADPRRCPAHRKSPAFGFMEHG